MQTATVRLAVLVFAGTRTQAAVTAARGLDHQLGTRRQALGIVTPAAGQRTAFHEHRRPHTRPVMHRELLYVKDNAARLIRAFSSIKQCIHYNYYLQFAYGELLPNLSNRLRRFETTLSGYAGDNSPLSPLIILSIPVSR